MKKRYFVYALLFISIGVEYYYFKLSEHKRGYAALDYFGWSITGFAISLLLFIICIIINKIIDNRAIKRKKIY